MEHASLSGVRAVGALRRYLAVGILSLFLLPTTGVAVANSAELVNALDNGVAMDGFDVVAYFKKGAPMKGSPSHKVQYKGKTWHFGSAENAADFSADPARYEPQHNGWCSYAVSEGYGAQVDFVKGWAILDDKLYLNWNEETKDEFVAEQAKRKSQAAANWPGVHKGLQDGSVELYFHKDEPSEGISHPQELN